MAPLRIDGFVRDDDGDLARLRELDRVADEVDEHLPQSHRVADEGVGDARIDVAQELEALPMGADREEAEGVTDRVTQVELDGIEVQLAGLDLREVEDVVDHGEQRVGGDLDEPEVLGLLVVDLGVEEKLRHADDAVHRGADLVAHVRQEFRLQPRDLDRRVAGLLEFLLDDLSLGDVGTHPDEPPTPFVDLLDVHLFRDPVLGAILESDAELVAVRRVGGEDGVDRRLLDAIVVVRVPAAFPAEGVRPVLEDVERQETLGGGLVLHSHVPLELAVGKLLDVRRPEDAARVVRDVLQRALGALQCLQRAVDGDGQVRDLVATLDGQARGEVAPGADAADLAAESCDPAQDDLLQEDHRYRAEDDPREGEDQDEIPEHHPALGVDGARCRDLEDEGGLARDVVQERVARNEIIAHRLDEDGVQR